LETLFKIDINEFYLRDKKILELGCGNSKKVANAIGVDSFDGIDVDVVADLNQGLPFEDGSIDEIYSFHFLEHVENLDFILKEIHRVLKPEGKCIGTVPHFSNPYFYSDPTHKSFFGLYSFSYFDKNQSLFKRKVPVFYTDSLFTVEKIKLGFTSPFVGRYAFKKVFGFIINLTTYTKEWYEENFCYMIPAYEVYFELKKS